MFASETAKWYKVPQDWMWTLLSSLKEMFFIQENIRLIMSCAAFIVLTSSFLFWTDAVNQYYYKGNADHQNDMKLVEVWIFRILLILLHCFLDQDKELQYLMNPPVYAEVKARRGENTSLPCILRIVPSHYKVKWSKVEPLHAGTENIILISNGHEVKHYGTWQSKASLRRRHALDISLHFTKLELQDSGLYQCKLINGIDDESINIALSIEGTGMQNVNIQSMQHALSDNNNIKHCLCFRGCVSLSKQLWSL